MGTREWISLGGPLCTLSFTLYKYVGYLKKAHTSNSTRTSIFTQLQRLYVDLNMRKTVFRGCQRQSRTPACALYCSNVIKRRKICQGKYKELIAIFIWLKSKLPEIFSSERCKLLLVLSVYKSKHYIQNAHVLKR